MADLQLDKNAFDRATASYEFLLSMLPSSLQRPATAVICGSGLSGLSNVIRTKPHIELSYSAIPHFPRSTVEGHAGTLLFGTLEGCVRSVVLMVGRLHFYEGHSIQDIVFPIRVLKLLGIEHLIVTNAAGGLNPSFRIGDIVVLSDHLNFAGLAGIHPLRGPNLDHFGVRFPSLSDAYDLPLRRMVHRTWVEAGLDQGDRGLHEGIYAFVGGPSYETRAECRMLRQLGADVVGMSTVPEVIVARHSGLTVLALSLITNMAVLDPGPVGSDRSLEAMSDNDMKALLERGRATHGEVLEAGEKAAEAMQLLISLILQKLSA